MGPGTVAERDRFDDAGLPGGWQRGYPEFAVAGDLLRIAGQGVLQTGAEQAKGDGMGDNQESGMFMAGVLIADVLEPRGNPYGDLPIGFSTTIGLPVPAGAAVCPVSGVAFRFGIRQMASMANRAAKSRARDWASALPVLVRA